jgi:hypothetical protein
MDKKANLEKDDKATPSSEQPEQEQQASETGRLPSEVTLEKLWEAFDRDDPALVNELAYQFCREKNAEERAAELAEEQVMPEDSSA